MYIKLGPAFIFNDAPGVCFLFHKFIQFSIRNLLSTCNLFLFLFQLLAFIIITSNVITLSGTRVYDRHTYSGN